MGKKPEIADLEAELGIKFYDLDYLEEAMTHSSYANEQTGGHPSNERLEFLGDAVLELTVSELLFHRYPQLPEGALTKRRAALVCEGSLVQCARAFGLGDFLRLGKGEELSGGRERPSLLADAFEAVIGAIYLDQGFEVVRGFLGSLLTKLGNWDEEPGFDYKTRLQEYLQQYRDTGLEYQLLAEVGPDHDKTFRVGVYVNGRKRAVGEGKSKKEAEQAAARSALHQMEGKGAGVLKEKKSKNRG